MRILFVLYFLLIYFQGAGIAFDEYAKRSNVTDDMVLIPGGKFKMGCNQFGPRHGGPEHVVHLDAFMIDKYEVSNKRFEQIDKDHELRRSVLSYCDDCPVTKISWYEAVDFCYLTGKTLPTEAQWERAAGGNDGCAFPWGNDFDPKANQAWGGLKLRDNTKPVGSFPPNENGIYDMAGNVWEWVSDWYASGYHFPEFLYNPKGPSRGVMKVRRGGSWSDSINAMATGYRDWSYPLSRGFNDIGFRCAINIKIKKLDDISAQD
ncbi:MAG: SUMF1/EgtB/PvdO family nonheme iron enzyme [Nitrospinaceae bacterium]|nr:SUMF1/EgtB/PvdO family nonheme iron enzyme [Nitrospinaceae bacterium]MDP7057709.1 SUMF1/EgtB/PvdO family nonheme iron enzyme [Nitrospinaceae bacterium]